MAAPGDLDEFFSAIGRGALQIYTCIYIVMSTQLFEEWMAIALTLTMLSIVFWTLFIITDVNGAHLPPFVEVCHKLDPKFQDCVARSTESTMRNFAKGYEPLGVPPLEPVAIDSMHIPGHKGPVSLDQKYHNLRVHGVTQFKVLNLTFTEVRYYVFVHFPSIRIEAEYNFRGSILVMPVNGFGPCNITLADMVVEVDIKFEPFKRKGVQFARITDFIIDVHPERVLLDFDNLVNGNEQLSRIVQDTLQENSMEVYKDVKPAYENALAQVYARIGNLIFTKVPVAEIIPD